MIAPGARARVPLRANAIPGGLRARAQWVCWRYERRGEKRTKVPKNPRTGANASPTDPTTWGSFTDTLRVAAKYEGIGFVFTSDDPFAGVDLDACRDSQSGRLAPWAQPIVDDLASYTEITPSGTGGHIIVEATLPTGRRRRGQVEMYDTDQFFTVTGHHLAGTPTTIERRQEALAALHARVFAEIVQRPEPNGHHPAPRVSLDDESLLERAQRAENGEKFGRLWRGDISGYASPSEADLALCRQLAFWTGRDAKSMDRLFRRSGLMREKWDEKRGESTYGAHTIAHAIAACREVYTDPPTA
jgi:putative DNA primase/helicase